MKALLDTSTLIAAMLPDHTQSSTHQELLMDWPSDLPRPSAASLYEWLNRAYEEKLLRRMGSGRRSDPYTFRLTNEDDEYLDRGEIPPLREMDFRAVFKT